MMSINSNRWSDDKEGYIREIWMNEKEIDILCIIGMDRTKWLGKNKTRIERNNDKRKWIINN